MHIIMHAWLIKTAYRGKTEINEVKWHKRTYREGSKHTTYKR